MEPWLNRYFLELFWAWFPWRWPVCLSRLICNIVAATSSVS